MLYMLLCDGDLNCRTDDIMIINEYLNEKQVELIENMTAPVIKNLEEEFDNDGICNDKENV